MKASQKAFWDQMRNNSSGNPISVAGAWQIRRLSMPLLFLVFFVSVSYVVYTVKLLTSSGCASEFFPTSSVADLNHALQGPSRLNDLGASDSLRLDDAMPNRDDKTQLDHIVFGIAASARLWERRKNYVKLWYKDNEMRGIVWLDNPVHTNKDDGLPTVRISEDTSRFLYKHRRGRRSAIRISRIVSETARLGMEDVRWFVMGDDDTVFITDNLLRVLNKYNHNQFYYIGSLSESHLQNINFSYGMAYGGGGFAISYPLAMSLEKMQDRCIERYPELYGSDDRMQACMAELGVPLTREVGFHQYDVHGDLFGLLAAHPVTPLVSLHHLDVIDPIFPNVTRVQALERLKIPMKLDSAGLLQQSICYDNTRSWTLSVSWGFAIQVFRGVLSPREMEMPSRTFLNWNKKADYTAFEFNTRPVMRNPCQKPVVFYFSTARLDPLTNQTISEYIQQCSPRPACRWKIVDPASEIDTVVVYKKPDPHLWDRSPRRNCCRILDTIQKRMILDVGLCKQDEIGGL